MTFADYTATILDFIRTHQSWAAPIVFVLAFGESLAIVSLVWPATVILFAIGGLLGVGGVPFLPVVAAGAVGGILGYVSPTGWGSISRTQSTACGRSRATPS